MLQFELFYYQRKMSRLHFVRPCIHALTHIIPEHFRVSSLTGLSQWTLERTIGNLEEEIRLHSNPYGNLSQRIIERSRTNALKNLAPDLFPTTEKLPHGSLDAGGNFVLLWLQDRHLMDDLVIKAFEAFAAAQNWEIVMRKDSVMVTY